MKRRNLSRTMQALGIRRATPRLDSSESGQIEDGGPLLFRAACVLRSSCQTQTGQDNRKSETGRLAKCALQNQEEGSAEKEERQRIAQGDLSERKEPELNG